MMSTVWEKGAQAFYKRLLLFCILKYVWAIPLKFNIIYDTVYFTVTHVYHNDFAFILQAYLHVPKYVIENDVTVVFLGLCPQKERKLGAADIYVN